MPFETTLVYSEALLRRSVFAYWRRSVGVRFGVPLLMVAVSLGALVAQGERSWTVGVLGATLVFGAAVAAMVYVAHVRNGLATLRAMGRPEAAFRAEADTFTVRSGAGEATLPWSAVTELWQLPEAWLLMYSKSSFSTLPVASLTPEMQAFVRERVETAGGRVVR